MSKHATENTIAEMARIVEAPKVQHTVDRTFELPTGLYIMTAGGYLGFIGLMASLFMTGGLAIPLVVIALFIVMAFTIPAMWTGLGDDDGARRLSWSNFQSKGVVTHDGPITAVAASAQVLILPFAILVWGLAIAVIVVLQ